MGLDRLKKTPCGFCFVEFYSRLDAMDAMKFLNLTKVDERVVRTDVDPGFVADRQYGRGKSGGQVCKGGLCGIGLACMVLARTNMYKSAATKHLHTIRNFTLTMQCNDNTKRCETNIEMITMKAVEAGVPVNEKKNNAMLNKEYVHLYINIYTRSFK